MVAIVVSLALHSTADPGAAALAVFQSRCAACHGPDVKEPKGRFGYVLDLPRLAADKERLTALGILVAAGNMPPRPEAPLTAAQKEAVRNWIAAGAPLAAPVEGPPTEEPEEPPAAEPPTPAPGFGPHLLAWLGKFHLLLLHFPIALVVVAVLLDAGLMLCKVCGLPEWTHHRFDGVRLLVLVAAAFAVPTVVLGWLHALGGAGASQPGTLLLHRWVGTAAGVLLIVAAWSSSQDGRTGRRRPLTRVAIVAAALLTAVGAHFGGTLVHGAGFLDW